MGTGYLEVHVTTGAGAFPVPNATVTITNAEGRWIETLFTNASGITQTVSLEAPDYTSKNDPVTTKPFATYTVQVVPDVRFRSVIVRGVQIFDDQISILPVQLVPQIQSDPNNNPVEIVIPDIFSLSATVHKARWQYTETAQLVPIPTFITVHLGASHEKGTNIRIPLIDYIKNVASCKILPSMPTEELATQIEEILTFVLHRMAEGFYKKQGFCYDITNDPNEDLPFVYGHSVFCAIEEKVLEIFCNLPFSHFEDVSYIHGIYPNLITSVPTLSEGMNGKAVQKLQQMLNSIAQNNPAIPPRVYCDGVFDVQTRRTVQLFQTITHLNSTGIVEITTWYTLYTTLAGYQKQLAQQQKRQLLMTPSRLPTQQLQKGHKGKCVLFLQIMLNCIGMYYTALPIITEDGVFGNVTEQGVVAFQQLFDEPDTGTVHIHTWQTLYRVYYDTQSIVPTEEPKILSLHKGVQVTPPQHTWLPGTRNTSVAFIQKCLNEIGIAYPTIPKIQEEGTFDYETQQAIIAFQRAFHQKDDGLLSKNTWQLIAKEYNSIEKTTIQAQVTF